MVILSVGVRPDTALAKQAGLALNPEAWRHRHGRAHGDFGAPDVYAVGDAIEITDFVTGNKGLCPPGRPGQQARPHCGGQHLRYSRPPIRIPRAPAVLKIFDMTVAMTGVNERTAQGRRAALRQSIYLLQQSHASYYPGGHWHFHQDHL